MKPTTYPQTLNRSARPGSLLKRALSVVSTIAVASSCLWTPTAHAERTAHNISAGWIQALQIPGFDWTDPNVDDNTNSISSLLLSFNDFRLASYNRGDWTIRVGNSPSDDQANGILISSVAQNVRTNYTTNNYSISMIETNTDGSYRIAAFKAGSDNNEMNVNVAGAYFPYSSWIGGHLRSEPYGNGYTNNLLTGSPGLVLGTHVVDLKLTQNLGGRTLVDLRPFGYTTNDGVLIANHGKDRSGDGNYAVTYGQADGTFIAWVRDHGGGSEQDPVAFVFIPRTNTTVVSGKFRGDGLIEMYSGDSPQFTITPNGGGRWILRIPGHSPTNGVLILCGGGGQSQNNDNCTTYEPLADMSGWEIQSRDLPGGGFQTPGSGLETIASFVYIPAPTPGFTVTPTKNLQTTESGTTATFTVALDAKPTGDVTINLNSSDTTEGIIDQSSLTFTPENWENPQTVTITGQDDPDQDGSVLYSIVLAAATSTDSSYNGMKPSNVSVVNVDNEPGVAFSKASLTTTEAGGSDSFDVQLNTQPTADVTVAFSSSDTTEGTVAPPSLTFTPGNWNVPQTVTVTGINDPIADGNVSYSIVTAPLASADPTYNNFNPLDVSAVNVDNDVADLIFNPTDGLTVSEPSTSTGFTLALACQPAADVTVSFVSSDTTEATISPASRTFTAANWATPQSFTVTAVDDVVNDGNQVLHLNGTVTSADAAYSAFTPSIQVSTLDDEAALTLPSGTLVYGTEQAGVSIDGLATVVDSNPNYNGGSLTVSLTANGSADDRLEIRNVGNAAGQIGVSGNTVSYGGTAIGTFSGGSGTTPLMVSLNAASSPEAVQALIRSVTFRNLSGSPSLALRTVTFALADGTGGTSTASKSIKIGLLHIADFQEGVDHGGGVYSGERDIEISNLLPDNSYPEGSSPANGFILGIDNQVLMRFDNIVGNLPGQIPSNAIIVSADLVLNVTEAGVGGILTRLLVDWDTNFTTYSGMGNGIDMDDVEAKSTYYSQWGTYVGGVTSGASTVGQVTLGVVPDVQAWANGEANHGWAMVGWPGANNPTSFSPMESTNSTLRPRLIVKWVPEGTPSATFRYGLNGYTGAHDTRVQQATPDTDASANTGIFVDGEVTGGLNDQAQVLIRFEDIIGSNAGQIPANATVHAAVVDLASLINDAMGDGGHFHAMLKPWQDSDTWNTMVNGISADGVEAAVAMSATAGNPSLNPDVQGTRLTFDLTTDVQAWANGAPNYGWAILPWPLGGNGWGFSTAEATTEADRPQLRVYYSENLVNNLVMQMPVVTPSSVQVRFSGNANQTYDVYRTTTITGGWGKLGSATTGTDGQGTYTDNAPPAGGAFYRVYRP